MAKQTIDIGTSANKGDGDPLRTAFRKINENFTELYAANGDADGAATNVLPSGDGIYSLGSADKQWADVFIADFIYLNGTRIEVNSNGALLVGGSNPIQTQDTMGSVFGDDSTLLVDGVNNLIPSSVIQGTEAANWHTAFLWGDHSAAGYAPQATTYTKVEVDAAIAAVDPFSGDVTGSVFADDSTLLVDGVNGKIVGDIQNNLIETNNITALPGDTDLYIQGGIDSGTPGNPARVNIGTTNTSTIVLGAGNTDIYLNGNASSEVAAGTGRFDTIIGDLTGSVFGDDSTLLVDGVNGVIPKANIEDSTNWDAAFGWGDHSVAGYAPQATTYTKAEVDTAISAPRDLKGSVFGDDSTLLVDGVGGTIAGPISSINWMAASDSYLTISNGGSTQPGPIQIVASANLDLSSGNNNDINITPHGSGRIKVSDGAFGIVEAANFIGHADQTMYLSSKTTGAESTHITLNSTSGVATTMYGAVDFVSGGSVDFTGSTVTGLNVTGDITGSIFADDSTLLVDGVNGTIPAANLTGALPAIDGSALTGLPAGYADSDVDTHLNTGSAGSNEVLSWTGSDYDWVAQSGGGAQTRSTVTGTTSSLADAAEADLDITGFKSYALLTITTDRAARVRLYVSDATRTADASRAEGVDPTSDAGLIAEVITTGADTVIISPGAYGFNLESSPTTTIPCRVTNKSGGTSTVQVDLNILQLEA